HCQHGRRGVDPDNDPARSDAVGGPHGWLAASCGDVEDPHSWPEARELQHPFAERRAEARLHGVVASPELLERRRSVMVLVHALASLARGRRYFSSWHWL